MSKRDLKKDAILSAGLEEMKARGYNGTSVKDIVDAAQVPKGSFYNYFESKEAFALDALDRVADESREFSAVFFENEALPPLERLDAFFKAALDTARQCEFKGGCFFGTLAQEMADTNDAIRTRVHSIFRRKTLAMAAVLRKAQARGELDVSLDAEATADFLFNAWEGALVRMKTVRSPEPLENFLSITRRVLRA